MQRLFLGHLFPVCHDLIVSVVQVVLELITKDSSALLGKLICERHTDGLTDRPTTQPNGISHLWSVIHTVDAPHQSSSYIEHAHDDEEGWHWLVWHDGRRKRRQVTTTLLWRWCCFVENARLCDTVTLLLTSGQYKYTNLTSEHSWLSHLPRKERCANDASSVVAFHCSLACPQLRCQDGSACDE